MFLTFPFFVSAYKPDTTHPALTNEIIKFFNSYYSESAFNDGEKELIVQGSIDEDEGLRPLRHFYDPVYDRGLVLVQEWQKSKEWAQDARAQTGIIDSAFAGSLQSFFSGEDDYSWERAIYEYVWGDKERGLESLGHVLHLLEDATVPDHTRNDAHPPFFDELIHQKSPYESWTAQFDDETINIVMQNETPILLSDLNKYFDTVANYSNNNFFSKNTILSKKYKLPLITEKQIEKLSDGQNYLFGYGIDNHDNRIRMVQIKEGNSWIETEYSLRDRDDLVLTDYWTLLSKNAVLNGAGVVKLFFDEVEKERQTKELYKKNRNWFQRIYDATVVGVFNLTASMYGSSAQYEVLNEPDLVPQSRALKSRSDFEGQAASVITSIFVTDFTEGESTKVADVVVVEVQLPQVAVEESVEAGLPQIELEQSVVESMAEIEPVPMSEVESRSLGNVRGLIAINVPYPGYGGGGGRSSTNFSENILNSIPEELVIEEDLVDGEWDEPEQQPQDEEKDSLFGGEEENEDVTPPDVPLITTPVDFSQIFTNSEILFSGTVEASSTVEVTYGLNEATTTVTTTVDIDGVWNFNLSFNEGTTSISFFAVDAAGNRSDATITTFFIDSLAPDVTLINKECDNSLVENICMLATTTLHFSWSSSDEDIAFFVTEQGGEVITTTATSTDIIVSDNELYIFSVSAIDRYDNSSATTTMEIEISTAPVIINEIAWMGTGASASDEWIELFNRTDKDINLSGWVLSAEDGVPYIPLDGVISAGSYYLIERTDDDTISDIPADLVSPFSGTKSGSGLGNNGEHLFLIRLNNNATTTIDDVAVCLKWCGGLVKQRYSMERFGTNLPGIESGSWGTTIGEFILNGKDADDNAIKGTPKSRNSISHLIAKSGSLRTDKTLVKENSPYLISRGGFIVREGATLTLESGVVIKIVSPNKPSFVVEGTVKSEGTVDEPVVITSFVDDEFGGDMNGDGFCEPNSASSTALCPLPGSWKQIFFTSTSMNSSLAHTIIRYGGRWFNGMAMKAMVVVDNTDVEFNYVTVEASQKHGVLLSNSSSVINNSVFQHNNTTYSSSGVWVNGGAPSISSSIFKNNKYGLFISQSLPVILSNIFTNNALEAVSSSGEVGHFGANSGSGNGMNAIVISGTVTNTGTTTLSLNDIPYVLRGNVRVSASSTLSFEDGVVIKGHNNRRGSTNIGRLVVESGGTLFINGDSSNNVIFTSIHDDSVGMAVDIATTSPLAGDWHGIVAEDGSIINMKGFSISYANMAFSLTNSFAKLGNFLFSNNTLDIKAVGSTTILCTECNALNTQPVGYFD